MQARGWIFLNKKIRENTIYILRIYILQYRFKKLHQGQSKAHYGLGMV